MGTLSTERLILRPVKQDDLKLIYKYASNENIGPHCGWKPHENEKESQEIMDKLFLGKETTWAIALKDDGIFKGVISLEDDPKRNNKHARMIGYWINEADWGRGYMTEAAKEVLRYAMEDLNAPIVTSNCFTYNDRSRNVIEKTGLKFEGIMRQAEERYDGKVFDLRMYSITKEEYFK